MERATIASFDYTGPLRHWGLNYLNHIVDVVASAEPRIKVIDPASAREPL